MLSIEEVKQNLINCDIKLVSYSSTMQDKFKGLTRIFLEVEKPMKMKSNTSC